MEQRGNHGHIVNSDLGTALVLLRTVAGWTQEELAHASGIRGSSLSDYERGKVVPGLNTLRRIVGAEGFPLAALEQALSFIEVVRSERSVPISAAEDVSANPSVSRLFVDPATFRREVEEVAATAANTVGRMVRLLFTASYQATARMPSDSESDSAPMGGTLQANEGEAA